jgi:hypothetical protein
LVESNEEQQPEEIGHEKADYQDLQDPFGWTTRKPKVEKQNETAFQKP